MSEFSYKPQFCTICGQTLETRHERESYDTHTGAVKWVEYLRCFAGNPIRRLLHTPHQEWIVRKTPHGWEAHMLSVFGQPW